MSTETEIVTLPEAALALGCSWNAAYRLVLNGTLLARQTAGRWVIDRDRLKQLIAERSERAGPPSTSEG